MLYSFQRQRWAAVLSWLAATRPLAIWPAPLTPPLSVNQGRCAGEFIWVRTQTKDFAASVLSCSIISRALLESAGRVAGSAGDSFWVLVATAMMSSCRQGRGPLGCKRRLLMKVGPIGLAYEVYLSRKICNDGTAGHPRARGVPGRRIVGRNPFIAPSASPKGAIPGPRRAAQ